MTITDQQIRALAFLAKASRPHGARRWDEPGIVAAITKVRHRGLAEVTLATIRAAADRDVDSPGVIPTAGSHWNETAAVATFTPTYRPDSAWCTRCGRQEHRHDGADHPFDAPVPKESRPSPEAAARIVEALKEQIPASPVVAEPIPLADRIAALPRDPALERIRAQLAAESEQPNGEPSSGGRGTEDSEVTTMGVGA